jgi:hypothetical protein
VIFITQKVSVSLNEVTEKYKGDPAACISSIGKKLLAEKFAQYDAVQVKLSLPRNSSLRL